jgi:preprotein translocase subunit SecD
MSIVLWTGFATVAMAGIFAACVVAVVVGVRVLESALAKRRGKPSS